MAGNMTVPEAISMMTGAPLEKMQRAYEISVKYSKKHPPGGPESPRLWFRRKWDLLASEIGVEHTVTYSGQELIACFGAEDDDSYDRMWNLLEQWRDEQSSRKAAAN